jgi:hypothetical protein
MSGPNRTLSLGVVKFRRLLIDKLGRDRYLYIAADHFVGECILCGEPIGVRFAGYAPRASLRCHGGCTEAELAELLQMAVRS